MSDKIIYIDLIFRCGDIRVSAQNGVTTRAIKEFRAEGYEGLIDATIAGLNAQLRPHVEVMVSKTTEGGE